MGSLGIKTKDEIKDVLKATELAGVAMLRRGISDAYVEGYAAALEMVAAGLGVDFQLARLRLYNPLPPQLVHISEKAVRERRERTNETNGSNQPFIEYDWRDLG